ncbi:LysR family transcriptional regulator, partial [Escherichia coli]|uniref:helix-turn-helix domain-containing protein n=1 Tax=Escherichia coli TaxID=562 RepID=UPI0028800E69
MKHMPKLQQIKFFNEIVLCGSLRSAARKMNISQPALSRTIKELENVLGCNLLIRTRDGGFAPIFPDICYHLPHYKPAAADIPV